MIEQSLEKAHQSFLHWKNIPFEERQTYLKTLADVLNQKRHQFGQLITQEMNKPISQAVAEVEKSAAMAAFYSEIENPLQPEHINTEFKISEVHPTPLGVILGVMPWNYPFWQVLRFAIPTILAGNTVVVKHASICKGSGDTIAQAFAEAGFPEGIFQHLDVGHQAIETILKHPAVQGVSLTGSEKAGSSVASIAGREIKKSVLELGGSDAFIILDDADLQEAASVGALSRLQNCGQTCIAAKRFIVHQQVKDEFLPLFIAEYQKFQPNDPFLESTNLSGMARKDLADELETQYQKAIEHGAEIVLPLVRLSDVNFQPGLILVKKGNPILQEELFGPLGILMVAENDEDAINLANAVPFGLGNAVWSANTSRALQVAKALESGTVSINAMTKSDARLPFGGVKKSGYGTELSLKALFEFTYPKTIVAP